MKLNEMFIPFNIKLLAEQTSFISDLRYRREKYYADFARQQEEAQQKKAKKPRVTRAKTREILLDPEKEKLILELFGEKGLKRARKGLAPQ